MSYYIQASRWLDWKATRPYRSCITACLAFVLVVTTLGLLRYESIQHSHGKLKHILGLQSVVDQSNLTLQAIPAVARNAYVVLYTPSISIAQKYADYNDTIPAEDDDQLMAQDEVFVGLRILTYQLLHAPETRTRNKYPLIVMVTHDVPLSWRDRLQQDGAIVVPVDDIFEAWTIPLMGEARWHRIFTKFRALELEQFDRIALLDCDVILARPMDGIFLDPAVAVEQTTDFSKADFRYIAPGNTSTVFRETATLPPSYSMSGFYQTVHGKHHYPPEEATDAEWGTVKNLNAGILVFKPSLALLKHYLTYLHSERSFLPDLPEQRLINQAHRLDGPMPWTRFNWKWGFQSADFKDLQRGIHALHTKWWLPRDKGLVPFMERWRMRMQVHGEMSSRKRKRHMKRIGAEGAG